MITHKNFNDGQQVSLKSRGHLSPAAPMLFRIESRLPNMGGMPRYKIRNTQQNYDRVEYGYNLVAAENEPDEEIILNKSR